MLDLKDEKRDAESFLDTGIKKLRDTQKQRLADIMLGMQLAEEALPQKKDYPASSVQATCM